MIFCRLRCIWSVASRAWHRLAFAGGTVAAARRLPLLGWQVPLGLHARAISPCRPHGPSVSGPHLVIAMLPLADAAGPTRPAAAGGSAGAGIVMPSSAFAANPKTKRVKAAGRSDILPNVNLQGSKPLPYRRARRLPWRVTAPVLEGLVSAMIQQLGRSRGPAAIAASVPPSI